MSTDSDKKLWTWPSALVDHVRILVRIPMMLLAPAYLTAQQMEAVQSAVSGVNKATISAVWHKNMGRVAGLDGITGVEVFYGYGRSFGLSDGTGTNTWDLYDEISEGNGSMAARSADAVAFLQLWMDLMGNTIGAFLRGTLKCSKREEQNVLFEFIFFIYYIVLYIMMVMGALSLKCAPAKSAFAYKVVQFVHSFIVSLYILPFGIIGLLALPLYICAGVEATPLPSRLGYTAVGGDDDVATYTINLVKPDKASKVGIRFGSNTSGQVMVTNIKSGSIASASDLEIGNIILSINGKNVVGRTPREAAAILLNAHGVVTVTATHDHGTVVDEEATV